MQAYQRKRHRILWVTIAVVVTVALLIAVFDHAEIPRFEKLPVATQGEGAGR